MVEQAARAPSGGNLQPWHVDVLMGEPLAELKAIMARRVREAPAGEAPEYPIYPPMLDDPYRAHRHQVGEDLYGHLGIARDNKAGRLTWFARNYQFFGAPVGFVLLGRALHGTPQWSDLGMYLQTLMLLLRAEGWTAARRVLGMYPQTVGAYLDLPGHPDAVLRHGDCVAGPGRASQPASEPARGAG